MIPANEAVKAKVGEGRGRPRHNLIKRKLSSWGNSGQSGAVLIFAQYRYFYSLAYRYFISLFFFFLFHRWRRCRALSICTAAEERDHSSWDGSHVDVHMCATSYGERWGQKHSFSDIFKTILHVEAFYGSMKYFFYIWNLVTICFSSLWHNFNTFFL